MSLDAADDKMVAGETPTQEKVEVTTAPPIKTSRRKVSIILCHCEILRVSAIPKFLVNTCL